MDYILQEINKHKTKLMNLINNLMLYMHKVIIITFIVNITLYIDFN